MSQRFSKGKSISCNQLDLGGFGGDVDITCSNVGSNVRINGILPGDASASLPLTGTGDISITGNITSNGDGLTNGKIEGQTIKSIDNIVISSGSLEVVTGGVDIKQNGNLTLEGNGSINQQGSGKITSGLGGIESQGDIKTIGSYDLEIGKDIYFDGDDIYKRTNNPVGQQSYKDFKQLAGKNDPNVFTGANQFNNTTEFAARVSVGTRDGGGLFTQNLALNSSGNVESKTINNATVIQCGNINCGNAGLNEVRASTFITRTNENNSPEGWTIQQAEPTGSPVDNVLQIAAGAAGAYIGFTDTTYTGITPPNIVIDPRTTATGGLIAATTHQVGQGITSFKLEQPTTGTETENLLINCGSNEGSVKFQNNAGNIDLAIIQRDSSTNQGRLYVPAIFFGTTGLHNSIVNDTSGPDSLVLKIRQATASSKVEFLDNADNSIMEVKKTEIELGTNIPIMFDNYEFRPQELTYAFTGAVLDSNPPTLFNSATTDFNRTNDGATVKLNDLGEAVYILSIDAGASSGTTIGSSRFMCNFPYMVSANASGSFEFSGNFCMNITPAANFVEPIIKGDGTGGPVGSTDYSYVFPSKNTTETFNGVVKITRLSY